MLRLAVGKVTGVTGLSEDSYSCEVELADTRCRQALAYSHLLPRAPVVGDHVVLNTTAVDLGLGTGGLDFVLALLEAGAYLREDVQDKALLRQQGHIMKLRYTPLQRSVLSIEAPESPWHELLRHADEARGLIVIAAELHSQGVLALRLLQELAAASGRPVRLAYIMPEGGALPAAFSRQLRSVARKDQTFCGTITCGEAYGGDYEAVTLHSALIAARHALEADLCVVAIGPGVVGTGTPFGTTALTQGSAAVARVSFADRRPRHRGLSHHTITVLTRLVHRSVTVAVPMLQGERAERVASQLEAAAIARHHNVQPAKLDVTRRVAEWPPEIRSMGRGYEADPAFFDAVGAAVSLAWRQLTSGGE